jgi:uncharacterized damage-inducible protein DinB
LFQQKQFFMTLLQFFLEQLDQEAVTTRKMLSLVPTEKLSWKPHEKSMLMKNLATHIAELPTWIPMTLNTDELDFAQNAYKPIEISNSQELLDLFEKSLIQGREALKNGKEEALEKPWTLRNGAQIYSTTPKRDVIRMTMSQIIHHRAQLGVYLRLLHIPIPGSYGPSADDMNF